MVPKSHSKTGLKNDRFLIDFGVPFGSKMEPKIDQKSIIFQVGVPEGPRGRFWKDFGSILELFWDDFWKVFGRISMLGLIVFQVLASSFWLRWWEISLCCFHPFGYDLGVVLCVLCHGSSHAYSCFDKVFASSFWGEVVGDIAVLLPSS